MIKNLLVNKKQYIGLLLFQVLIIILLFIHFVDARKNAEIVSPPISMWESRMIQFDEDGFEWFISGQFYREAGYTVNEDTEAIYGPFLNLKKGNYTLTVDYQVDSQQTVRAYAFEQEDKIHCWEEKQVLSEYDNRKTFHYTLSDDVDNFEVRFSFNGQGDIHIRDITIVKSWIGSFINLVAWLVLFATTDLMLLIAEYYSEVKKSNRAKAIVYAIATMMALCVNTDGCFGVYGIMERLWGTFKPYSSFQVIMMFPLILYYEWTIDKTKEFITSMRARVCVAIPSMLFSAFIILGNSYEKVDSWDIAFGGLFGVEASYLQFLGYGILIYYLIALLFMKLEQLSNCKNAEIHKNVDSDLGRAVIKPKLHLLNTYFEMLHKSPFLTTFITLGVLYIPWAILSYPGIATGDTADIILQAFNIPGGTEEHLILLSENVLINQHHPVVPTLIIHGLIIMCAEAFNCANLGLFIYCLIQASLTMCGVSMLVSTMEKEKVNDGLLMGTIIYFAFHPRIQNYIFVLTKDTCYAAILLISVILLWKLVTGKQITKYTMPVFIICLAIMQFFQNAGIYIVVIVSVVGIISGFWNRKGWLMTLVCVLGVYLVATKIIFPLNYFTPGSRREALSIPAQQTARYLIEYPEDVTQDELDIINKVWNSEIMASDYNPIKSDFTKNTFNKYSTTEDLFDYFKVWLVQLFRHPDAYVQATMNNYYEYFYPGEAVARGYLFHYSDSTFEYCTTILERNGIEGINLYWPMGVDKARTVIENIRETLFRIPVLSMVLCVATYIWTAILTLMYMINKKNGKAILILLPVFVVILVCLAASSNGSYFRYVYPIVVILPAALGLCGISDGCD